MFTRKKERMLNFQILNYPAAWLHFSQFCSRNFITLKKYFLPRWFTEFFSGSMVKTACNTPSRRCLRWKHGLFMKEFMNNISSTPNINNKKEKVMQCCNRNFILKLSLSLKFQKCNHRHTEMLCSFYASFSPS